MSSATFKAMIVEELADNTFISNIRECAIDSLPAGEVLIKVFYSSLNYKDALSARGHKGITRKYPHTPGIDASGEVVQSRSPLFTPGQRVLVTGYDLGMNTSGGFGQYISVPASWVVSLPEDIDFRVAMIYGTAGFTAALAINELQRHNILPDSGKILVTGSSGGVGSLAVAMLSKAGYEVSASTGKRDASEFLMNLGAKEILSMEEVRDSSKKPLLPSRWSGVIDTVGGNTLSTAIRSVKHRGLVACIGLVESDLLETTVYPFILRGITLTGIDSAERPMDIRRSLWKRIFGEWRIDDIFAPVKEVSLDSLDNEIYSILHGRQTGRVIVNLWK